MTWERLRGGEWQAGRAGSRAVRSSDPCVPFRCQQVGFSTCHLPPPLSLQVGFIGFFWAIMMFAQKYLNFNKR